MTIEQEIALIQFAQGHLSEDEALEQMGRQGTESHSVYYLEMILPEFSPSHEDVEQALSQSAATAIGPFSTILKKPSSDDSPGERVAIPQLHPIDRQRFMLHLFKITYQRYSNGKKDDPQEWRFQNLARPEVVQEIIQKYRTMVEKVYSNPEYRREFESVAKLFFEMKEIIHRKKPEPEPGATNKPSYITYDALITSSVEINEGLQRKSRATSQLLPALTNAIARHYGIDINLAHRIVREVVSRHHHERYGFLPFQTQAF